MKLSDIKPKEALKSVLMNTAKTMYEVGDIAEGGIIAYLFKLGDVGYDPLVQKGYVIASSNAINKYKWYEFGYGSNNTDNFCNTSPDFGSGADNTYKLMNTSAQIPLAAIYCSDFISGGFSDWFWGSSGDYESISTNTGKLGFVEDDNLWTSSSAPVVSGNVYALYTRMKYQYSQTMLQSIGNYVRPIRTFSKSKTGIISGITESVYTDGSPTSALPDTYIEIMQNGSIKSKTSQLEIIEGVLIISINVKLTSTGTVNSKKENIVLNKFESLFENNKTVVVGSYHFILDPDNLVYSGRGISEGYSTRIINILVKIY